MLRPSLKTFAPLAFVAVLALGGCATTGSVSEGDEEVAGASEAVKNAAPPHERQGAFGHSRGASLAFVALHELDLTDEQRKTIESALPQPGDKEHGGMRAFGKAMADGVRAGKIDEAAVKAKMADLEQAASARRAAEVKALKTLHATLTPAQREALVAHVEERMQQAGRHFRGHDGEGHKGHGRKGARGPQGPGGEGHGFRGPMGFLLHGIELREEQRTAIASALEGARPTRPEAEEMEKKHEAMRARMKAGLTAFRAADFDPEAILPEKMEAPKMDHLLTALQAIVPVLDEAQRTELARRLEEGPRPPHFGGRGRGARDAARPAQTR